MSHEPKETTVQVIQHKLYHIMKILWVYIVEYKNTIRE